MIFRLPRWIPILVVLALAFAIVSIRSFREPVLRAAGWALVVNEPPVAPADIIVLTLDSGGAGALEAADGFAPINYHWFVLSLDLLYVIGAVELERGLVRRAAA